MTKQQSGTDPALDRASPEDAAKRERETEKLTLLTEIATLATRKDALEELIEEKQTRLEHLMSKDGDSSRMNEYAEAAFGERRVFAVIDPAKLAEAAIKGSKKGGPITVETLAEGFRPTAAFYDGAVKAGVDLKELVTAGADPTFTVRRPQTKAAKTKRGQIIEQTKAEAEAAAAEVAKKMLSRSKK